jgi:hypothetical protein
MYLFERKYCFYNNVDVYLKICLYKRVFPTSQAYLRLGIDREIEGRHRFRKT